MKNKVKIDLVGVHERTDEWDQWAKDTKGEGSRKVTLSGNEREIVVEIPKESQETEKPKRSDS